MGLGSRCLGSWLAPQKAKKKALAVLAPAALGVELAPRVTVLRVEEPPQRQAGLRVETVADLVAKLRESGCI